MEITGRTALLAFLADPVAQARAPGLVNAALAARGLDALLMPLHVPPEGLGRVVLVVNGTSLGMRDGDALPLDARRLDRGAVAAEIVIADEPTPFLAAARERGCAVHFGQPMLEAQIELMLEFMALARPDPGTSHRRRTR
jgi:shikimate dehydrogenase